MLPFKCHSSQAKLIVVVTFSTLLPAWATAGEANEHAVLNREGKRPAPVVAVDNVCAWPNLTVLPDGTIVATIFNQPSHLQQPGDVECWASKDSGRTWVKHGTPAPRDNENVARGNVAAGVAGNGDLIVITSGWSDPTAKDRNTLLPTLVSRSADQGRTWSLDADAFPGKWPEIARNKTSPAGYLVPFGDILIGADGKLRAGFYRNDRGASFIYSSQDNGKTWDKPVALDRDAVIHEPALFHLGEGRWLAATRNDGLDLYASDDDARSWVHRSKITGHQQHPAHLTRLENGTLLLTNGNRLEPKGVDARFSDDEGVTWSEPFRVVDFQRDGGYPSSVQLPDGNVITAYYAQRISGHDRYHMGVVEWDPGRTRLQQD